MKRMQMKLMVKRPDEFSLIERYFAPLSDTGAFGLKDDAALLGIPSGKSLVVTNDAIAEGIHFLTGTDPHLIAQKAIRTNLSDLAAKGAKPISFSLALGLHEDWDRKWIARFAKGLESDCKQYAITLCGGDTFQSPGGLVVAVTAYGHINRKNYASRLSASAGDQLYVSGTIGDAALGLSLARKKLKNPGLFQRYLIERYDLPQPRVDAAELVAKYASAAMDISDGFVGDLGKLCKASGKSVSINIDRIPLSPAANAFIKKGQADISQLIAGGDDYELLLTVPKNRKAAFEKAASKGSVDFVLLGEIESGNKGVTIVDETGCAMKFPSRSYVHFEKSTE